jgi:hypothetical protein
MTKEMVADEYGQHPPWLQGEKSAGRDSYYPLTGHTEIDDMADVFHPFTYRYKEAKYEPRSTPTGARFSGVMAQSLEQHPLAAQIVEDTPDGKRLEGPALMSALAAMAGRQHDRLNDHEQVLGHFGSLHEESMRRLQALEHALGMMGRGR